MLRFICLLGLLLSLNACEPSDTDITPLIGLVLEDIVVEGKSMFRIRKDLANKSASRIGFINILVDDDSTALARMLSLSDYEFSQSSFSIPALNAQFENIEVIEVPVDDFNEQGFEYYTSVFMVQNELNAIFVFSDCYSAKKQTDGAKFINVCFFWKRNARLLQYQILRQNGEYELGESRFMN